MSVLCRNAQVVGVPPQLVIPRYGGSVVGPHQVEATDCLAKATESGHVATAGPANNCGQPDISAKNHVFVEAKGPLHRWSFTLSLLSAT